MIRLVSMIAFVGLVSAPLAAQDAATPKGWGYEIKDGKRVAKGGQRVSNADGGWREETRKGGCTEVKEMSPTGELKITRQCDPAK